MAAPRRRLVLPAAAAGRGYEGLRRGVDYLGLGFAGDYLDVDAAFFFYLGEHLGAVFRVAHRAGRAGAVGVYAEGLHQVVEGLHRLAEPRAALRAYRAAREGVLAETHGHAQEGDLAALFVRILFDVAYQEPHGVASDVYRRDGVHVLHYCSLSSSAAFL